jgi:hypothetical protein
MVTATRLPLCLCGQVVKGTNAYGRGPFQVPYGYAAAVGWDAASGLGTPNYDKLLAAALEANVSLQGAQEGTA